jgi:predicted amidohydrolase YtcJ
LRSAKLFADGVAVSFKDGSWTHSTLLGSLASRGAAMLEPYYDEPESSGLMIHPIPVLKGLVERFWKGGWQLVRFIASLMAPSSLTENQCIHAIGDRANKVVLDIFEDILVHQGGNASEWRPRIEHAQIMTLGDLDRAGRLGSVCCRCVFCGNRF